MTVIPDYKLPAVTCELFKSGNPDVFSGWSPVDIRLGIEQVQDTPEFRHQVTRRWEGMATGDVFPIEAWTLGNFLGVSPRHNSLSTVDVELGMNMILDDEHFRHSCENRWEYFDENPPAPKTHFQNGFDISAMPEGPMSA